MSNFTTFLDNLNTRLAAITELSSKTILPNPYDVEANPEILQRDGYGVVVQDSVIGLNEFNTSYDDQGIGIILVREVIKTENNPTPLTEAIKTLKSDSFAVRKDLLETLVSGAVKIDYVSTDAIAFSDQLAYTTVNFNVTISDVIAIC